jgi:hypothetical protein
LQGPTLLGRLGAANGGFWGTVVTVLDLAALVDLPGEGTRGTAGTVIWILLIALMPLPGSLVATTEKWTYGCLEVWR